MTVTAASVEIATDSLVPEQAVRIDTAPIEATVVDGTISINLVGPDVTDVQPALDEHFEDVVLVGRDGGFRCSGVMITPRHVLTAAHCLPATRVGIGNGIGDAVAVTVTRSTQHPKADIAVLHLAKSVEIRARERRSSRDSLPPAGLVRIIGFGVSDQLNLTGFGRKRSLLVPIDGWGCNAMRARELGCAVGTELVLRGGRGNDTCLGDSGGPLFEQTFAGWRLVGITSRGTRPKQLLCGEGGIYSRIDVIADWIEKVIKP